ncbi:hypothetical protein, partial [Klebsiella pneumoniae]|uniref:hypothetical protein n=1 Tax=Klebsiella pneumoniae TaxID=573 RepID=UPI00396964A9
ETKSHSERRTEERLVVEAEVLGEFRQRPFFQQQALGLAHPAMQLVGMRRSAGRSRNSFPHRMPLSILLLS